MKKQEKDMTEKAIKDGAIGEEATDALRRRGLKVLAEVKAARANKKFKTVRLDYRTWKEVEVKRRKVRKLKVESK